jgi:hypothetical protein
MRDRRTFLLGLLFVAGCWLPISSSLRSTFPGNVPVEVKCDEYERDLALLSGSLTQMAREGWRVMYIVEGKGPFGAIHTQVCYERPLQQAPGATPGAAGEGGAGEAAQRQPRPLSTETTQQIVERLEGAAVAHRSQLVACRNAPTDPPSVEVWVTVLGSGVAVGAQVEGAGVRPELAVCVERVLKTFRIAPFEGERTNKKIQVLLQ